MMKKILALTISALFTLSAQASNDNGAEAPEAGDNFATEHQELDNDLQNHLQMNVSHHTDGSMEIKDKNGEVYSVRTGTTSATGGGCPTGQTVCYENSSDGSGGVVVRYSNGKSEILVGESHNENQLLSDAGSLGLTQVSKLNGVATFRSGTTEYRVRYSPLLRTGAANLKPGLRVEQDGRIIERYADGMEQEILPVK